MRFRPLALGLAACAALALAERPAAAQGAFYGFLVAGANANQINGDDLAGYNHLGGYGGVGVYNDLADRWRWSLAIAYTRQGSRATSRETVRQLSPFDRITLDYVAVPARLHFMDWLSADETFYHLEFTGGVEYYRLIGSEVTGLAGDDITEFRPYADNAVALTVGALYAWSLRWGASINYNRGVSDAQARGGERRQFFEQLSFRVRFTL